MLMARNNRRLIIKGLALLLMAAVFWLPQTAEAKVVAYVTETEEDELYEFDYTELVRSFVFSSSSLQPMYREFLKGEAKYLLDDLNGYVDYHETVRTFVFSSGGFDLDAYTSGPDAIIVPVERINVVTVEDGQVVYTEKVLIDPVEDALNKINEADSAPALRIVLEGGANVLGLDMSSYNGLSDYGKTMAASAILQQREEGFASVDALQAVFNQAVQELAENPLAVVLHEVNSVDDAASLRNVLEENAGLLELDMSDYTDLAEPSKNAVMVELLEQRGDGFADAAALATAFADAVAAALSAAAQFVADVNAAAGEEELEPLLQEKGEAFDLALASYNLIIESRKQPVLASLLAARPFADEHALRAAFNQAVAEALTSYVVISYSSYEYTIEDMVNTQMSISAKPQISSGGRWVDATADQVEHYVNSVNFIPEELIEHVCEVIVAENDLRMRETPGTDGNYLELMVDAGEFFTVEDWAEVTEGTLPGTEGYWFKITKGDVTGWVCGRYTDLVAEYYDMEMFQFLHLSGPSGISVEALGAVLNSIVGSGNILSGTEGTFYQAAQENNINEIFLLSLALHETGNGLSTLANGYPYDPDPDDDDVEPVIVYNMFGIGAYDNDPLLYGSQRAYNEEWFTPEAAITGGAVFASNRYVNSSYRQDTLYKMRWNPGNPGTHQYATDVAWASKQVSSTRPSSIGRLYELVEIYNLRFDLPRYQR